MSYRSPTDLHTSRSSLLSRRRQSALPIHVPAVYTNVAPTDTVQYLGERVVPLRRPAVKRGIEPPLRGASPHHRATWSHPTVTRNDDLFIDNSSTVKATHNDEHVLHNAHSSGSGSGLSQFFAEPKRARCAPSTNPEGHFIARLTPSPVAYPGMAVLQRQGSAGVGSGSGAGVGVGVVTPPQQHTTAPMSAASDGSFSTMSVWSSGASNDVQMMSAHQQQQQHVPVFAASMGSHGHTMTAQPQEDPTMQQYYARQYTIKQEQAFPCHQVIDMGPHPTSTLAGTAGTADQAHHHGSDPMGGWTSVLRSLAGSLKRTLSP